MSAVLQIYDRVTIILCYIFRYSLYIIYRYRYMYIYCIYIIYIYIYIYIYYASLYLDAYIYFLFQLVDPTSYPKLFKQNLNSSVLSGILRVLLGQYIPQSFPVHVSYDSMNTLFFYDYFIHKYSYLFCFGFMCVFVCKGQNKTMSLYFIYTTTHAILVPPIDTSHTIKLS